MKNRMSQDKYSPQAEVYILFVGKDREKHTLGPVGKEVPDSAIAFAQHSFLQNSVKQQMLILEGRG